MAIPQGDCAGASPSHEDLDKWTGIHTWRVLMSIARTHHCVLFAEEP